MRQRRGSCKQSLKIIERNCERKQEQQTNRYVQPERDSQNFPNTMRKEDLENITLS